MDPPPNYKPGVGRGAVGFQTEAERLSARPSKRGKDTVVTHREANQAQALWDMIDNRKRRKTSKPKERTSDTQDKPRTNENSGLKSISAAQWENLPDAADATRRNKRTRQTELMSMRSYSAPSLNLDNQDNSVSGHSNIGDFDRVRSLLEGLCKVEPQNSSGWIGLSRLEMEAGRQKKAKAALARGCEFCAHEPAIWHEALKVYDGHEARTIAEKAVRACVAELSLWVKLVELTGKSERLPVLRRALEYHPTHANFWIMASELEADPLMLLETAVEFVPDDESLWLRLAELKPQSLEKAPSTLKIWVSRVSHNLCDPETAIKQLKELSADDWLAASKDITTAFANVLDLSTISASSSWAFRCKKNISSKEFSHWATIAPDEAMAVARSNPEIAVGAPAEFWTRFMKSDANEVLQKSNDESTWYNVADTLPNPVEVLSGAYSRFKTPRSAYRLIHTLLWAQDIAKASGVLQESIVRFPDNAKLQIQGVQLGLWEPSQSLNKLNPRDPLAPVLYCYAAEKIREPVRRRALLTEAIKQNPRSFILWEKRVALDPSMLDEALRSCPECGYLWWLFVTRSPRMHRKKLLAEALQRSKGNSLVVVLLALDRWTQGKSDQARELFEKAVRLDKDNGDVWLWYCYFDNKIVADAAAAFPHHGYRWQSIRKKPENYRRSLEELFRQEYPRLKNPLQ